MRQQAASQEDGHRCLGKARGEIERPHAPRIRGKAALLGHDGESEKARTIYIEREKQKPAGSPIFIRVGQDESEGNETVEGEIEHDIEEAAEIHLFSRTRNGAVQSIAGPACADQN